MFSGLALADWKASVGFSSDNAFRGYSKSDGSPIGRANVEYEHSSGLYGGAWVSQVDFGKDHGRDRAHWETIGYLGGSYAVTDDLRAELELDRYFYDGRVFGRTSDYNELYASLHFRDLLTARFAWSGDAYGRGAATYAYELQARHSLTDTLQLSAGLGYHQAKAVLEYDYFYWNAGATWRPMEYLAIDVRYIDADLPSTMIPHGDGDEVTLQRLARPVVFSVTIGF